MACTAWICDFGPETARGLVLAVRPQPGAGGTRQIATVLALDGSGVVSRDVTDPPAKLPGTVTVGNGLVSAPAEPAAFPFTLRVLLTVRVARRKMLGVYTTAVDAEAVAAVLSAGHPGIVVDAPADTGWPFQHNPTTVSPSEGVDVSPARLAPARLAALRQAGGRVTDTVAGDLAQIPDRAGCPTGVVVVPLVSKAYTPADPTVVILAAVGVIVY